MGLDLDQTTPTPRTYAPIIPDEPDGPVLDSTGDTWVKYTDTDEFEVFYV